MTTPWKTIKLGTGIKDTDGFRKAIKHSGMRIEYWADFILEQPDFAFLIAKKETEINLITVTVAELGFTDDDILGVADLQEIYAAAEKRGYKLCPSEVGPQLRLQYQDQPPNESLLIGMEPIESPHRPMIFAVDNITSTANNGCLSSQESNSRFINLHRFMFVLPPHKHV